MKLMSRAGLSAVAAGLAFFLGACGTKSTDIEASGTVEATNVQVSSRSAGEILAMAVSEGRSVKKGDLLAEIDHASLDLQLGQARSGVDLARAELNLITGGARGEDVSQAQEALTQAQQALRTAQSDSDRTARLFAAGAATPKERDDAEARLTSANAQAAAAGQALKKLQNLSRPEDVQAASARVSQAEYAVRLLEKSVADCTVTSPIDGTVTEKLAEAGELAAPGTGLYVVSDLSTVKLTIYVPEADLGSLRIGQNARIRIDAFPGRDFAGTVTWISPTAEFTPRDIQTRDERVKLVFAVRIEIANPDGVFKAGMPADAIVAPGGAR
jgi:HlyD family secretion protein